MSMDSVQFGAGQQAQSQEKKKKVNAAGVLAGAGLGAAVGNFVKTPQYSSAQDLINEKVDEFHSTLDGINEKKEGIEEAKSHLKGVKYSTDSNKHILHNYLDELFKDSKEIVLDDSKVQKLFSNKDMTIKKLKEQKASLADDHKFFSNTTNTIETAAKGDIPKEGLEIKIGKDGTKMADDAKEPPKETYRIFKDGDNITLKTSTMKDAAEAVPLEDLKNYHKAEKITVEAYQKLHDKIDFSKDEVKVTKSTIKEAMLEATEMTGESTKTAFDKIKEFLPKKTTSKTYATAAAIGAAVFAVGSYLASGNKKET